MKVHIFELLENDMKMIDLRIYAQNCLVKHVHVAISPCLCLQLVSKVPVGI